MMIAALLAGADYGAMTEEQLDEWITARLKDHSEEFPRLVDHLRKLVHQTDPVNLLALLTLRMLRPRSIDPEVAEPFPIIQPHLEFLQALILQSPERSFAWGNPRTPTHLDEVESTLQRLSFLFMTKHWIPSTTGRPSSIPRTVEQVRGHTQFTRNWGYPEQIERLVSDMFAPLEDRVIAKTGVRISNLVQMNHEIMDVGEARLRRIVDGFSRILSASSKRRALDISHSLAPDIVTNSVATRILAPHITLHEATAILLEKLSDEPGFNLTFTTQHFADGYPGDIDLETLAAVLHRWSHRFGDLARKDSEHFVLDNPVWTHPLIALTDSLFYLPILPLLNSWCLELMEAVIRPYPELWRDYRAVHRGNALQRETERLFRIGFPDAAIYPKVSGPPSAGGAPYECDLLVLHGSGAIFVEAKADKLGDKARRGAEYSLTDDVYDLVGYPAIQANRFRDLILTHPGPISLCAASGEEVVIDGASLQWTSTLAVTLEWNFLHRTRWCELQQEGLVPDGQLPIPVVSVADLECVFQTLRAPVERQHYLRRRVDVETVPGYSGSELDLLAFYLDAGFDDGVATSQPWPGGLDGRFKEIDASLSNWFSRRSTKLPRRRMTKLWSRMLQWLEVEGPERWLDIGVALLDVGPAAQERLRQEWDRQSTIVRAPRRRMEHAWIVHEITSPAVRCALILVSHRSMPSAELDQLLQETATSVGASLGVLSVIAIGRNVEHAGQRFSGALVKAMDSEMATNT